MTVISDSNCQWLINEIKSMWVKLMQSSINEVRVNVILIMKTGKCCVSAIEFVFDNRIKVGEDVWLMQNGCIWMVSKSLYA